MRKGAALLALCACVIALVSMHIAAREPEKRLIRRESPPPMEDLSDLVDPGLRALYEQTPVDTYCLAWFDFETNDWQGWTRLDRTAQRSTFFHVDGFAGLGGGDFGKLHPLEGSKSMWCGARPNGVDPYFCSWAAAPGYGSVWDQSLVMGPRGFVGAITCSYKISWDSEPGYDYTYVEYDAGGGNWQEIAFYTGRSDTVASHFIPNTMASTKLRFHFESDGSWNDEDGLWNTDGGCIVDSIRVSDQGGFVDFENFESAAVGAKASGLWRAEAEPGFGLHAGLWMNLVDKDPCGDNFGTQVVFFVGSTVPSSEYPGLYDTPFCKGGGGKEPPCQDEAVVSPVIDTRRFSTLRNEVQDGVIPTGDLPYLGGFELRYALYADNPLRNLVLDFWQVRSISNGCPGPWVGDNTIYYAVWYPGYHQATQNIRGYVTSDSIQVALGVVDMCDVWYNVNGDCAAHTPAPWYDNVRVYRYTQYGPQWFSYGDQYLFQDNFPSQEADLESWVRADAGVNRSTMNGVVDPGDSIVMHLSIPDGSPGIGADPVGGPAVYMHVKCSYIGAPPLKPPIAGASLEGSNGEYRSDDGTWTIIRGDGSSGPATYNPFAFDLNDSLLTRGYMVEYYFTARDSAGLESAYPWWARSRGPYFEFTCLPTRKSEILFVDDFDNVQLPIYYPPRIRTYWERIFENVPGSGEIPDFYHVNNPYGCESNGLGGRAKSSQLASYETIVWDCGPAYDCTITDGTNWQDETNDCRLLIDWMNLSPHDCGLWVLGDDVAREIDESASPDGLALLNTWCGADLVNDSYYAVTGGASGGGVVSPLVLGDAEVGIFVHGGAPDSAIVFGGCEGYYRFDVLEKTGTGKRALRYPSYQGVDYYAAIANQLSTGAGYIARTMWFGFSMIHVRDDRFSVPIDRYEIARDVLAYLQNEVDSLYTASELPKTNRLAQNFPNPFNPSTTIRYDLKAKGHVTIKVFDVSGRLVRTLLSGVKDAGSYAAIWDGANNLGAAAASGIYFCKMETAGFSDVKKLVLLR